MENIYDLNLKNKINDYLKQMPSKCYLFEITKLCGFSSLMYIYKEQNTKDLYLQICFHFGITLDKIKELYFINYINNEKINIPFDENLSLRNFIYNNNSKNSQEIYIKPKYEVPNPVVYSLYLNDGHIH